MSKPNFFSYFEISRIMASFPQIVAGTYEEFLLGYEIKKQHDGALGMELNLASHAHQGSIRCLASHRQLLASSGADEYVNVYSMVNRKEVAVLTPHAGTVTSMVFTPDGTHLISGSQDGSIAIFRCSDWTMMKVWKNAHKKANGVVALSCHPSGKLLLSIGADNTLKAWNLVKGRLAYAKCYQKKTSPGNTLNLVSWSGDGNQYAIALGQTVEVYDTDSGAEIYALKAASKVSCFDLSQNDHILVGNDDGRLEIHDLKKKERILEHEAHDKRVKCALFFKICDDFLFIITADSQGRVRLWKWKTNRAKAKIHQEAEAQSDCRIVCMLLMNPNEYLKTEKSDENGETEQTAALTSSKKLKTKSSDAITIDLCDGELKTDKSVEHKKNNKKRKSTCDFNVSTCDGDEPKAVKRKSTSKWVVD